MRKSVPAGTLFLRRIEFQNPTRGTTSGQISPAKAIALLIIAARIDRSINPAGTGIHRPDPVRNLNQFWRISASK